MTGKQACLLLLGALLLSAYPAPAQDDLRQVCGDAPLVKDESLNAYVEAKGSIFFRRVADASIKANIERTAQDVFSKYPNADRTRIREKLLNTFCYAIMGSPELSAKEKIDYWFKIKKEFDVAFVERLGNITDQNDYFVTEVSSAKRSRDGKVVIIAASLRSAADKPFHMSYLTGSGLATDSDGNEYTVSRMSGIGSVKQCSGSLYTQDYTLITPNSTQTLMLVFESRQPGGGDIAFSTNFCISAPGNYGVITVGFHNVLSKL